MFNIYITAWTLLLISASVVGLGYGGVNNSQVKLGFNPSTTPRTSTVKAISPPTASSESSVSPEDKYNKLPAFAM